MSAYDGDIKLSMSLDPKDVKSASKSLQSDIKDIFEKSAGKKLDSKFKNLEASMSKAASKAQKLQEKLEKLENQKIHTEEYNEVSKRLEKMNAQFDKLLVKQDEMQSLGKTSGAAWEKLNVQMEQLGTLIHEDEAELQRLVDTGKAFTLGSDSAEYEKTVEQLAGVNNEMRVLTTKAEEAAGGTGKLGSAFTSAQKILSGFVSVCKKVSDSLINVAKKLWGIVSSGIKNGIKGLSNAMKGLSNSSEKSEFSMKKLFWTLMKYGIGIRSLYVLFRRLRGAITEGLNNLVQFNGGANQANAAMSQLMSSLTYLKNAWGAAFAPILSYVAPALSYLINMIAAVVNRIGMLFAALSGRTSFRAAKLSSQDYASSLGGGGGSSGKSAQEKYEEAKKKAQERYEKQLAKVQETNAKRLAKAEEKQAKAAAKLAKAQEEANNQLAHYDKLNVITKQELDELDMDDFMADLLEEPELEEINWEDFLDAGGAGAAIADMFEDVPIDPWLMELADKIKDVINQLVTPIKKAWDEVKDYVLGSFKNMIKKIWSLISTVFKDFLKVWNQQATVEMLKTIFEIFGDIFVIIGNIAEGLEEAWSKNETGLHILENLRDAFKIIVDHVKNVTESLKEWSAELDFSPMMESIQRFTDSLKQVADFIGGVLEDLFNNLVEPFFKYVIEVGGPRLLDAITAFINEVDWEGLRENINKIIEAVEKLLEGAFNDLASTMERLGPQVAGFLNSPEFAQFCDNVAHFIQEIGDSGLIEKIFGGLAIVIGDIGNAIVNFVNSETFQKFMDWLLENIKNMSAEDVAKIIEDVATAIGVLAGVFSLAGFVGQGILNVMKFIALLNLVTGSGGLAGAATALEAVGSALGTIASFVGTAATGFMAIADAWLVLEDCDLFNLWRLQDSLPTSAKDTNGFAREVEGLGARILDTLGLLPDGVSIGSKIVVPSDYEKLETMVSKLGTMEQELGNTGQLSDDVAGKIGQAWDVLGDNFETVENLTDDQVRAFGYLYQQVEDYYNKCTENDAAIEALGIVTAEWEKIPEALPTEEDGKTGIQPFTDGVVSGVTESLSDSTKFEEGGRNISQGVKKGAEEELDVWDLPSLWQRIKDSWDTFWDSHSPSVVMEQEGIYLIQGVQNGITNAIGTLIAVLTENLDKILNKFKETWDNLLKDTVTQWQMIQDNITTKFTELRDNMKTIGKSMQDNLDKLVQSVGNLFDKMHSKITSVVDSIKSTLSGLVSSIKSAVSSVTSAISSITSAVSSAASSAMSGISSITSNIRLPHLAQGAVIPPNREFMAVLGDQRNGMNVETPLATMVEAFNKALDARGGVSNNQPIVLQLNSETIAEAVWDEEEKRYKQRGDWEPLYE